jgi:hypothetical protein
MRNAAWGSAARTGSAESDNRPRFAAGQRTKSINDLHRGIQNLRNQDYDIYMHGLWAREDCAVNAEVSAETDPDVKDWPSHAQGRREPRRSPKVSAGDDIPASVVQVLAGDGSSRDLGLDGKYDDCNSTGRTDFADVGHLFDGL